MLVVPIRMLAGIGVAALSVAGCGTRVASDVSGVAGLNTASAEAAPQPVSTAPPLPAEQASAGGGTSSGSVVNNSDGTRPAVGGGTGASHSSVGSSQAGTKALGSAAARPSAQQNSAAPKASPAGSGAGAGTASGSPSAPAGSGGSTVGAVGRASPVVVASVGTYSGPAGSVFLTMVKAAQAWVQYANGKGGVNGHPVRLLVYDDAADPARSQAQVREAVEKEHAIAFLHQSTPIAGESSVQYINAKRIPVIGTDTATPWSYASPMYFPQTSSAEALTGAALHSAAQQLVPSGQTKLGVLTCSESPTCDTHARVFQDGAKGVGFELVYRGRASIAQPDFTAECLSARNAGAQVLAMVFDLNSVLRVAQACARQGYRPAFVLESGVITDDLKKDPNLDGAVGGSTVFPYFQTGTPATDEYQRVMRTVGSSVPRGVGSATGWVSGKLFELAAAKLPEPPTSQALLEGLWAIKGNDLGGLTQPLTFVKDQPAAQMICFWNLRLQKGSWVNPDGKRHCV